MKTQIKEIAERFYAGVSSTKSENSLSGKHLSGDRKRNGNDKKDKV